MPVNLGGYGLGCGIADRLPKDPRFLRAVGISVNGQSTLLGM
jgi:hypothetical protein